MPLTFGASFGPYVVQDLLGKGGMGEVYRAQVRDSGEILALKILSENFAQDAERLARFELEVKALGAMHHPNIPVFMEAGQVDGVPFLAMELLEGETLERRLQGGPLPTRVALEFARAITRGLGAAHARGIIHRDLKPANIILGDDGVLKILDFGLAKDISATLGEQTMSSPASPAQTRLGTLIGTVGYMAPEQVRGQKVDHRADIFAVGILLYQMLFGEPPFHAESPFDVLSAILKDTPSGLSQAARSGIPKEVTDLVARCLEKQPEKRFQTTGELLVQLDILLGDRPREIRRWPGVMRTAMVVAGILGALSAGAWLGWREGRREPPALKQLTFRQGYLRSARFEPTGDGVLYSATWSGEPVRIYGTRPERPESRQLDLAPSELLAVSSRGDMAVSLGSDLYQSWIYRGTLARTHVGGGTPRVLLEGVIAADWVGEGEDLALVRYFGGKCRLEYPMGNTLYASSGWISHPRVSPDGQGVAFIHHPVGGDDLGYPCYVDLKGQLTTLTRSWSSAQGLAWKGDEIWFTAAEQGVARALWAVDRSKRLRLVARYPTPLTLHDISRDGKRVLLAKEFLRTGIKVKVPDAPIEQEMSWLDWSLLQDLSTDAKTLLFSEQGAGSGSEYGVYLRRTDGSPAVLLGKGANPMLSPDGKWVAALKQSAGAAPFLMATDTGESRPIHGAEGLVIQRLRWFPDGRALILSANLPGKGIQLFRLGLEGGVPTPVSPEGFRILGHPISPDGKWVAAYGVDGGSVLFSTERAEQRAIPGLDALERVVGWSEDGRALFAMNLWKMPCTLTRLELATGRRETVFRLLPEDPAGLSVSNFVTRKDGKAYAYAYRRVLSELYLVEGLK